MKDFSKISGIGDLYLGDLVSEVIMAESRP